MIQADRSAPQQPPGTGPGGTGQLVNVAITPPTGDYSDKIKTAANQILGAALGFRNAQGLIEMVVDVGKRRG